MSFDRAELGRANMLLAQIGIPHDLETLGNEPGAMRAQYYKPLLSLLGRPWSSSYIPLHVFRALANLRLGRAERLHVATLCVETLRARPEPGDGDVEMMASCLLNLVDDRLFNELSDLALDRKFGSLCNYFCHAIASMKDPRTAACLEVALENPETRLEALQGLARRDPAKTFSRMSQWIGNEGSFPQEFHRLYRKLRRKVEGFTAASATHRTRKKIPSSLRSWSGNVDGDWIGPILSALSAESKGTLGSESILEVQGAAGDLRPRQRMRFEFRSPKSSKASSVWIGLEAEDEDAFILTLAGTVELMNRFEPKMATIIESLQKQADSASAPSLLSAKDGRDASEHGWLF